MSWNRIPNIFFDNIVMWHVLYVVAGACYDVILGRSVLGFVRLLVNPSPIVTLGTFGFLTRFHGLAFELRN